MKSIRYTVPGLATAVHPRVVLGVLTTLLLAYAGSAAWHHWHARARLPAWPVPVAQEAPVPGPTLRVAALDLLFGLAPGQAPVASAAALVLRASIVGAAGSSRALLAGGSVAGFYREGERLPDGSVLRAIHSDRVLLWRNGREETLAVARPATPFFTPAPQVPVGAPVSATSLLRPAPPTEAQP